MDINKILDELKFKELLYPLWIVALLGQLIIASFQDWEPKNQNFNSISDFVSNVEGICLEENGLDECIKFNDNKVYNSKIEVIIQKYKNDSKIIKITPAK